MDKCYSELIQIPEYSDRLDYLILFGKPGYQTFGHDRYLNQKFYTSSEWRRFRRDIIVRDHGCDLAHEKFPIMKRTTLLIHHINPVTIDDIRNRSGKLLDPENVVAVAFDTHEIIHFGSSDVFSNRLPIVRTENDTCPWR